MDIQRKCFEESNNVNPDWSFKFNEELQQYIALDSEMELQVDEFNELWDAFRAGWQAAKAQAVPKWINVNLLSPQVDTDVLVCVGDDVKTAIYRDLDGEGYFEGVFGAKWWMPKPKAQEQAND